MGRGSYNGGSTVVRGVGWATSRSKFGDKRPSVRLGKHANNRRAALAAKKGSSAESTRQEAEIEAFASVGRKAAALKEFASFEAYAEALAKNPGFAAKHGVLAPAAKLTKNRKKAV